MAISLLPRYEFELKIKKFDFERQMPYDYPKEEREKEKLTETMEFKSLTAIEVVRKLLDYLH